jgi:hypothetical protein
MVVGKILSGIIVLTIAGSLLISGGLSAYSLAANYTGLLAVLMPFVPVYLGVAVIAYAAKQAGINIT